MKKLMTIMVAFATATIASAAQIQWKTTAEIANGTLDGITSATLVYLIDTEAFTQSSIYDAVCKGKSLSDVIGANSVKSATLSNGKISAQTFDTSFNAGVSKTLYMVLFDSDVGENGALYFSEQVKKTLSGTGAMPYNFSSDTSISSVAANMTGFSASDGGWVAVPEPTSGLLLVLGMAGLVLRRRRA